MADVAGEPVAAIGIWDGQTVAHPTGSHRAIVAYLQLRRLELVTIAALWGA
jgi:hypothetical protein